MYDFCTRKALIDLMREFKREQDERTRGAAAPLVKSFQNEVDALSRRSRSYQQGRRIKKACT